MNDISRLKVPPHSTDAEISVLGALLLDKNAIVEIADILEGVHFYDERHKDIYDAVLDLYKDRIPIDVLTVSDRLKKKKVLKKIGGVSYLAELVNKVPTAAHVEHYAKIVRDHATKRSLMTAASRLVELSLDEGLAAEELLDKAESEVFSLTQRHLTQSFTPVKTTLADSFDRLDELHKSAGGLRGIPTGFADLDNLLAGFQKSNLIILAARPGVGKTSFALNIAQHLAVVHKRPVGFFSLEMSKEELVDRLLVSQADIDAWKLKTGRLDEEDFTKLSNAMGELAEAPFYIDDTPGLSILEMRTKARRLQVDHGIDLIVIDYLQLAKSRNLENRVQEVSEISQGFKNLARELKVPVLALSQLSRSVEQRGVKRPQLSDLRESGCLTGDTLITLADTGERVRLDSLLDKSNFNVFSMSENFKLKASNVTNVFSSGVKKVYELKLRTGKTLKASANHKFYTVEGWKRLDKIKVGDKLATPHIIPSNTKLNNISPNKIILLAHLLGDGCFVKGQPIHYTNSDLQLINIVKESAQTEFDIKPRLVKQKSWYHLYLTAVQHLTHGVRNPIAKWLDDDLNIYGLRSRLKYVPQAIFNLNNEDIALFLKHLWSTDGCIFVSDKGQVKIYYASGSKNFAFDVQSLLLRFGIVSTVRISSKVGYQNMWIVDVQGKDAQLRFLRKIGCVGKKAVYADKAIQILSNINSNPNLDVVPKEIWNYIRLQLQDNHISTRAFHSMLSWSYSGTQRFHNGISRIRLAKIAEKIHDKYLKHLSKSDLYWDEIVSINYIGKEEVFDMTVPKYSNFVANEIIVHNSIEQDADVVMFLWKEDDDSHENVALDISKHRNGPTGQIKLFFKGDRIRYYGRDQKH